MKDAVGYARQMAKIYRTNPDQVTICLKFSFVTEILNEAYQLLTNQNKLNPIEQLTTTDKNNLWTTAKKYSDKKEKCILICRSLHLLQKIK